MLTKREKGLIRALMYPVQFDENPAESIGRVLRYVVQERSLNADAEEYSSAIKSALGNEEELADILPDTQEGSVVRNYLEQVQAHLVAQSKPGQRTTKMDVENLMTENLNDRTASKI